MSFPGTYAHSVPASLTEANLTQHERFNRALEYVEQKQLVGFGKRDFEAMTSNDGDIANIIHLAMDANALMHRGKDRISPPELFVGYIDSAGDKKCPKKFVFDSGWVIADFTRVGTGEKRKIIGNLPYVQKYVVYKMKIEQQYSPRYGCTDWHIRSVETAAPYHNMEMFSHFVKAFAKNSLLLDDDREKFLKVFVKEIRTKNLGTVKDWFEAWPEGNIVRKQLIESKVDESNPDFKIYHNIELVYNARAIFANNKWWSQQLLEQLKAKWEMQFDDPQSAFKMCFRQTMPRCLRYCCYRSEKDRIDDAPFVARLHPFTKEPPAGEEHPEATINRLFGPDSDRGEDCKFARDPMEDMMLELNRIMMLEEMQIDAGLYKTGGWDDAATERSARAIQFVPECSYDGFKNLCKKKRWVEQPSNREDNARDRIVPDLSRRLAAIAAYSWMGKQLRESNECRFDFERIPKPYHVGIEMLVEIKVFAECVTADGRRWILSWHWLQCQIHMVRRLKNNSGRPAPKNNYNREASFNASVEDEKKQIPWNDDHRNIVEMVIGNSVSVVCGGAGVGKTAVLSKLDSVFEDMVILSFMGKPVDEAASRVKNAECSTIHSWLLRPDLKTRRIGLLAIDESSTVAKQLAAKLLAKVLYDRLVWVGDPNQISPFGQFKGCLLRECLDVFPVYELKINYRQLKNPLNLVLPNAKRVLEGEFPLKFDLSSFRIRKPAEGVQELIREHQATNFEAVTVITGINRHVRDVNFQFTKTRHLLTHPEWSQPYPTAEIQHTALNTFVPGDTILFYKKVNRKEPESEAKRDKLISKNPHKAKEILQAAAPDYMDDLWNQAHYQQTGQTLRSNRCLCRNGQSDIVEGVFHVTDWIQLMRYYEDAKSEHDRITLGLDDKPKKKRGKGNKRKKADSSEPVVVTLSEFNAALYPAPESLLTPISEITRARFNPQFLAQLNDERLKTHKERDQRCLLQDGTIVLRLRSGRWCRLGDGFMHGYALTINKKQGGSNECIALYMPGYQQSEFLKRVFSRNHFYTSITRAIAQVTCCIDGTHDLKAMIDNLTRDECGFADVYRLHEKYYVPVLEKPVARSIFDEEENNSVTSSEEEEEQQGKELD